MKIILSLAVIFTSSYLWSSSNSQAVLAQSFVTSTKLVLPDAQRQANVLLLKESISEKERDGCVNLLMAERPSAAVNELTISLRRLQRELASIEDEQNHHKLQSQNEWDTRKKQRDICHQMHNEYLRLHQQVSSEIEAISMELHSPDGKIEISHDRTLIILEMIQTLNDMLIADPNILEVQLKKGGKTKELQGLLRTLDLGAAFAAPKPSQATQSNSNDDGDASEQAEIKAIDNDPVQKAKLAERKKAQYLSSKQTHLLGVMAKSSVLVKSLDEEELYYVQKCKTEADSYVEKLANTSKLMGEVATQLEEKKKELTKYNDLIELIHKKKVRS